MTRLQRFANGDTDYVDKHNSNAGAIEAALAGVTAQLGGAMGASISVGEAFVALFGPTPAVVSATSYQCSGASSTLTVQPGYAWRPDTGLLTRLLAAASVTFAGASAATYYIRATTTGAPERTTNATGALYSVVWNGSAFGAITRLANIIWGAADWVLARSSAAYATEYDTLDARLEATEVQVGSAGLARTAQTTRTVKGLAGVNVTLTDVEANADVIELTGTISANLSVTVPSAGPRSWLVINNTAGNFRVTFKLASGSGVVLPHAGAARVHHTGTDTVLDWSRPGLLAVPSAASVTADYARTDQARITLTANTAITLAGATRDGDKLILEVVQNATGGWAATWGSEITYGSDLPSINLSTAANAVTVLGFRYVAATGKYRLLAQARGF